MDLVNGDVYKGVVGWYGLGWEGDVLGVFIFCLRVCMGGPAADAWGSEPVELGLLDGGTVTANRVPRADAYVYSGRDEVVAAAAVGDRLGGMGMSVQPVADVRGLGFWPVASIVRAAVAVQDPGVGRPMLLDWTGEWGDLVGFKGGGCEVLVMGVGGREEFRGMCSSYLGERGRFGF